jgi:hypothetical protein
VIERAPASDGAGMKTPDDSVTVDLASRTISYRHTLPFSQNCEQGSREILVPKLHLGVKRIDIRESGT